MSVEANKAAVRAFFSAIDAVRLTIQGTHTQPFVTPTGAIPPAGKAFQLPALNLYRFEAGKVVEHRSMFDMLGFLQQIGAMPA